MLARAGIEDSDSSTTMTPARPTPVVDDWLERACEPARPFTRSLCEYVPRHRAEAAPDS